VATRLGRTPGALVGGSRGLLVSVLALLVIAVAPRPAEVSAAEPVEPAVVLPPVLVTAPVPLSDGLPRDWVPSAVDSIRGRDAREGRPAVLPDALERSPGVTLQNEQGNPFQSNLSLRGFTASSVTGLPQGVSVFLDGVRLNEPTVEEVNFDLIPLDDVKSIEVIRGPSVLFGRNTLGGAINIITRRGEPTRELVPELEGGSFGRLSYRLRASGEARPLDYHISLTHLQEDGYRDFTPSRLSRGFGKLGARAGELDATVSYQYSNNRIKQAGSLPARELGHDRTANFTAGDFYAPELHLAVVNVRDRLTDHLTMEGNAFVRDLSVEQFNVNATGENSRLINHTRSVGGRIQTSYDQRLFGHDNVLIAGAEYTRHDVTSRTFQEGLGSRSLEASLADGQDAVAAYLQDSLALARGFAGPRSSVIMTVAGRWDLLRHRIDDRLGGPSGGTHAFQRVNPRAGVNVNLSEHVGAFVSYGEGFRAPAFLELTCAGPGAVCPGLQVGVAPDPPLKAVKARTYEVGVYARPLAWLDLSATVYRSDVQDDIFAVAPTGTTGVFFQNIGSTRRQGVEASARGRAGSALDFYLNYAYTEATFEDRVELATPLPPGNQTVAAGRSFALVPRHRANVGLIYRPWPWLGLGLDVRYVSSQFLRGDEVNRQAPLPGFWVVDAGITIKQRGLEAFLKVNNVLDNRYETFGTFAANVREAGAPVERFLTPAPPIHVLAGVSYVF
jgi:outer membrane receptor protein involved in Fe transport